MASKPPPRIRGAIAVLKRDRGRYWVFERAEPLRGFPRDAPGAAQWLKEIPGSAAWPERLTKKVNILAGLELHENVLTPEEEASLVLDIKALLKSGERNELPGETYTSPPKTREGNGRRTMQFG